MDQIPLDRDTQDYLVLPLERRRRGVVRQGAPKPRRSAASVPSATYTARLQRRAEKPPQYRQGRPLFSEVAGAPR